MSTTYICTQGTSIANCAGDALRTLQHENLPWDGSLPKGSPLSRIFDDLRKAVQDHVRPLCTKKTTTEALEKASAELKILSKSNLGPSDSVVLLATDTLLCRFCAEKLKEVIVGHFGLPEPAVVIERIEGLQVHDAGLLQKKGFGNFIDTTRKRIEEARRNGRQAVLCPNGGFKGVVPFLTILGMLYRCQVLYTFELAETKLRLPYLPFTFDSNLYRRAAHALQVLDDKIEMPAGRYLSLVDKFSPEERDLFLGFVQQEGEMVTPSPLLENFISGIAHPSAMLSDDARKDLQNAAQDAKAEFERLILDAQDTNWLKSGCHYHTLQTTDLAVIKTGHSRFRLLGYPHDGSFYVARAVEHDEYDRLTSSTTRKPPQVKDYPPERFSPWKPDDPAPTMLEYRAFLSEREEATRLEEDLNRSEEKRKALESKLEADAKTASEELEKARQENAKTRAELEKARQELAEKDDVIRSYGNRSFLRRLKDLFK